MICKRHADTDAALEFCKSYSLLLALDTETPQDQLRVASSVVIDTFEVWRDEVASMIKPETAPATAASKSSNAFSDETFGKVVSVVMGPDEGSSSSNCSSRESSLGSGLPSLAPPSPVVPPSSSGFSANAIEATTFGDTVASEAGSPLPGKDLQQQQSSSTATVGQSKIFRAPAYFFSVGFLRLRRLAHSRFRLRDILRRYMAQRRDFIDTALEQWRELELTARVNISFDQYVLVFVDPSLRRQILVDFHCACAQQCQLFLRAVKIEKSAQMGMRKTFFVWAYHQRKVSSTTFRIAIVTMLIFQERARKRAWVRKLLGQTAYTTSDMNNKKAAPSESTINFSQQPRLSFGRNSRVASLLLAGCTAPTKWCKSLLSLQSLAWCCALRRHKFQSMLDTRSAFFYSDLSSAARQIKKHGEAATVPPCSLSPSSSSSLRSSSSSSSSLSTSAEAHIELDPATLALCFAPWYCAEVTATWFSLHLQKFAVRQLAGAQKSVTTLLAEHVRRQLEEQDHALAQKKLELASAEAAVAAMHGDEREQQQQQQHDSPPVKDPSASPSRRKAHQYQQQQQTMQRRLSQQKHALPSAPSGCETSAITKTEGLWAKFVLASELFAPFSFVDLNSISHDEKQAADTIRDRLSSMQSPGSFTGFGNGNNNVFMTSVRDARRTLETKSETKKLQREYVFRGRRHFEDDDDDQQQQQQPQSPKTAALPDIALGKDGALVSNKKKVQISIAATEASSSSSSPKATRPGSPSAAGRRASFAALQQPTKGQIFSQQQLRKTKHAEWDYAHNYSFLDGHSNSTSVFTSGSPLHRSKSSSAMSQQQRGGPSSSPNTLLPAGSFRRKVNGMMRSASLRLPTSRSFRGIHSSFTSVAAGKQAAAETGLKPIGARCPTLWGSLWVTDPHWERDVEEVQSLFFNPESLYRKVLRLCVVTGALRITDPYLYRRLERVNQMMIAARMREEEASGSRRRRKSKKEIPEQQQQQQQQISSSRGRRSASPLKKEEEEEDQCGRMMWTPKCTREPVVVCSLFGQITDIEPSDVLGVSQHEAQTGAMMPAVAAASSARSKPLVSPSASLGPGVAASLSGFVSNAAARDRFIAPSAPVFFAPMRPSAPRSAKGKRTSSSSASASSDSNKELLVSRSTVATASVKAPVAPLTTRAQRARPAALSRPSSTLLQRSSVNHSNNSSSNNMAMISSNTTDSRIVEVDDDVIAAENRRCNSVAPAPPAQKSVQVIVRGAAHNRKRVIETRATAKNRPMTPVAAAATEENTAPRMMPTSREQGVFVIERSELHQPHRARDWTNSGALPTEAPKPFGWNAGFPAIFKVVEGRMHSEATSMLAAPPKHHL